MPQYFIEKQFGRVALVQELLVTAITEGNIDQVGRDAWNGLVDLIQEGVMDQVNEWNTEYRRSEQYASHIDQNERIMNDPQCDKDDAEQFAAQNKQLQEKIDWYDVSVDTFPDYHNNYTPVTHLSRTYNNSWDMSYGFVSSCMTADMVNNLYQKATTPV